MINFEILLEMEERKKIRIWRKKRGAGTRNEEFCDAYINFFKKKETFIYPIKIFLLCKPLQNLFFADAIQKFPDKYGRVL